ncbi:MAG: DUF427 domain-containing protein [Alphaproteobacteria bacterium]|nr:DUF427 domain-containing protein [Alphaproteobacteria bacterium]
MRVAGRTADDAVWSYPEPLPECPRINNHFCFYPEKVERMEVEGEGPHAELSKLKQSRAT